MKVTFYDDQAGFATSREDRKSAAEEIRNGHYPAGFELIPGVDVGTNRNQIVEDAVIINVLWANTEKPGNPIEGCGHEITLNRKSIIMLRNALKSVLKGGCKVMNLENELELECKNKLAIFNNGLVKLECNSDEITKILMYVKVHYRLCFIDDPSDQLDAHVMFINFHHSTGKYLHEDMFISNETFRLLFDFGFIEFDGVYMYQGEASARYKFVGYTYPKRFYKGYYKPKLSDYSKVLKP